MTFARDYGARHPRHRTAIQRKAEKNEDRRTDGKTDRQTEKERKEKQRKENKIKEKKRKEKQKERKMNKTTLSLLPPTGAERGVATLPARSRL